jgi:hypothetical protein
MANIKLTGPAAAAAKDIRFVDLSQQTTSAKTVREGYLVPATQVNKQRAEFLIDRLAATPRKDIARVVTQSIPVGTHVARGTAVDLVLAPKQSVPLGIFEAVHVDLRERTIDFLDDVLDDPTVRELTLGFDAPDKMTAAQKKVITDRMEQKNVRVDESNAERSFGAMFEGLRAAAAYR